VLLFLSLLACDGPACLDGDTSCLMPSPCEQVAYTCEGGSTEAYWLGPEDVPPGGLATLAAAGDLVLANDRIVAVIEGLDHPHYIAPTGGGILDLSIRGKDNDSLRQIFQATGLLPEEGFHYTSMELLTDGDIQAVQLLGTLDGYPDVPVATRYEIRPCEPGLRVRTEIANGTPDALSMYLTDGFYWGSRELIPFTPRVGAGFTHPSFGLGDIGDAFFDVPFMVAGMHSEPAASYGVVACSEEMLNGFQSDNVSAMGPKPRVFPARDWDVYERFIFAADGASISGAADIAWELREQLWGESWATLSGTVVAPGGKLGENLRASLLVIDSDGLPVTHILPANDGTWSARVPANRSYTVHAEAFGREVSSATVKVGSGPADAGEITLPAVGEVSIDVLLDGVSDYAVVNVIPADDATAAATEGSVFGFFDTCAPMLGLTHGGSPSCNRVIVNGPTTIALPSGNYDFYTSRGPFSTLGSARGVTVEAVTGQSVTLEVTTLDVQPAGTLTGDFHVHGGASFDSNMPDDDRVKAFVASGLEVVVTTEHDVVNDYAAAIEAVGVADRFTLVTGTEATGHVLFRYRSDYGFPQVVGHWMYWPVVYDPTAPWRGAAYDEKAEPGLLTTRQEELGFDKATGVVQLNHPNGGAAFGRDYSWATAMGIDQTLPLDRAGSSASQGLYFHKAEGARYSNDAYDVQEVMNGTTNENLIQYRSFWHYLLDQGIVRGGTANSDSHSLVENVLGTPRNVVFTNTTRADFNVDTFDEDVRAGHILGTNGPVIVASIGAAAPGLSSFSPAADDVLHVVVTAAPWVPVDEVRVLVNGTAHVYTDLAHPTDPFGSDGIDRLTLDIPLTELLPAGSVDAWIVVEAGAPLVEQADLDCNGLPDTGDNNVDGTIDWRDVEELTEDPGINCFDTVGPLAEPEEPERDSAAWLFQSVTPGGYPMAFTNPFLLDRDGDGAWSGPGLP
jgi:hypothetical protein